MATVRRTLEQIAAAPPEVDTAMMDATTEEDVRRQRVEDGEDSDATPGPGRLVVPPARLRERLGLTQQALADLLGIPVGTLRNWEQGRTRPDPAARTLLAMLAKEPKATLRTLRTLRVA